MFRVPLPHESAKFEEDRYCARSHKSSSALLQAQHQLSTSRNHRNAQHNEYIKSKHEKTCIAKCNFPLATHHQYRYTHSLLPAFLPINFSYLAFFPATNIPYTSHLHFENPTEAAILPCYRVLDLEGNLTDTTSTPTMKQNTTVQSYRKMICMKTMDSILYDAQRQGRISFYMTCYGEEAVSFGTAAALNTSDVVFAQYREPGVLMWRGFHYQDFADQCFGNNDGHGKGRQMPVHYGSKPLSYHTISSPLATQIPHAVGAAYALKLSREDRIAVCYLGEGAASEGDFHAGLNAAATRDCPVLFVVRNNGYAISTPRSDQYRGDGIATRGIGYGIAFARVDGNDLLAVYETTTRARKFILENNKPMMLELMCYRTGHHSTSDDSTRYRPDIEMSSSKECFDPILRVKRYLIKHGWWSEAQDSILQETERNKMSKKRKQKNDDRQQRKKKSGDAIMYKDLASKKEHVRELAKGRRWKQIKQLYGEKMVIRAKNCTKKKWIGYVHKCIKDLEKTLSKQTPAFLAMQILEQNGYGAVKSSIAPIDNESKMISSGTTERLDGEESRGAEEVAQLRLTEEQRMKIEEKRKEALARRKELSNKLNPAPRNTCSEKPQEVTHFALDSLEQELQAATEIFQSDISDHSGDVLEKSYREIVHYSVSTEEAHQPVPTTDDESEKPQALPTRDTPLAVSLSQEILAATAIIEWEEQQEQDHRNTCYGSSLHIVPITDDEMELLPPDPSNDMGLSINPMRGVWRQTRKKISRPPNLEKARGMSKTTLHTCKLSSITNF
uniref:2oxoisovalerate dehydrogenase alpha subunit putative n=1 Tax=Albugo laibachii Nc14 TaxID=890382 RepID=F0W9Y0_9STRA|nr:2oxoisovalerate dehydrogenase alpha subunit putative [Albugo laibachii Nc14]|eukprot:CCA17948.1 2oxoisovalerate dehydrogenase alpha subunit putative [Albugo laibachii Nc14]